MTKQPRLYLTVLANHTGKTEAGISPNSFFDILCRRKMGERLAQGVKSHSLNHPISRRLNSSGSKDRLGLQSQRCSKVRLNLSTCESPLGLLATYERLASSLYQLFPWLQGQAGVNNSPLVDTGTVRQEGQTLWKSLPFLV